MSGDRYFRCPAITRFLRQAAAHRYKVVKSRMLEAQRGIGAREAEHGNDVFLEIQNRAGDGAQPR